MSEKIQTLLLVGIFVAGSAGLAFTAAILTGDQQLLQELFEAALTAYASGAVAIVGLIAHDKLKR